MTLTATWEGIAGDVLEEAGATAPVSAFALAAACGFTVRPHPLLRARLDGSTIYVNARARPQRQHGLVAHELGHWALERAAEPDTELGARYLAGALMLPRLAFDRDLRATGWSLVELQARHPNASAEMIARRVTTLRDAVASIWDGGRFTARVASPWLELGTRPTVQERQLAATTFATGEVQHPAELVWSLPVFDGAHRRVVVVIEAAQLALRW